ncbi:hypothetical protein GCM10027570_01230 [Streptomonospora sediminis]
MGKGTEAAGAAGAVGVRRVTRGMRAARMPREASGHVPNGRPASAHPQRAQQVRPARPPRPEGAARCRSSG